VTFQTAVGLMIYSLISNPAATAFEVARGCRRTLFMPPTLARGYGVHAAWSARSRQVAPPLRSIAESCMAGAAGFADATKTGVELRGPAGGGLRFVQLAMQLLRGPLARGQ